MTTKLILGSPGCGKTTRLISIVDAALATGVQSNEIAFISYTKAAASVAAERAVEKFGVERKALPYFRTIHSLAFTELGINRNEVLTREDYRTFADLMGVEFSGYLDASENPVIGNKEGDAMLAMISIERATQRPLADIWREYASDTISWHKVKQFAESFIQFKMDKQKLDFADMLQRFSDKGDSVPVKLAIVDEAQDLSMAQWAVVKVAFKDAKEIYIAGDDDQAIYKWSGACVDKFLNVKSEQEVLPVSYRIPEAVFTLANKISSRIDKRFAKEWDHTGKQGTVNHVNGLDKITFKRDESWMILARNTYLLKDYKDALKQKGLPFLTNKGSSIDETQIKAIFCYERLRKGHKVPLQEALTMKPFIRHLEIPDKPIIIMEDLRIDWRHPWFDNMGNMPERHYYREMMRLGYKLSDKPHIYVGTIHSVKGGEADNVLLCTDMSYKTYSGYERFPDDEHRVFYVAVTRTRKNLYIDAPKTMRFYNV